MKCINRKCEYHNVNSYCYCSSGSLSESNKLHKEGVKNCVKRLLHENKLLLKACKEMNKFIDELISNW